MLGNKLDSEGGSLADSFSGPRHKISITTFDFFSFVSLTGYRLKIIFKVKFFEIISVPGNALCLLLDIEC